MKENLVLSNEQMRDKDYRDIERQTLLNEDRASAAFHFFYPD